MPGSIATCFAIFREALINSSFREVLTNLSFPRKRESRLLILRDTRFRWHDVFAINQRCLGLMVFCTSAALAEVPVVEATLLAEFDTFDASQGVAVDENFFYAVNNTRITRHDKKTGEALLQWDGGPEENGLLIHLDGAMVHDGKIYAPHSNYPQMPMTSSIEVWDAATLEHIDSFSFGVNLGSLTWIDYHAGEWWAAFGNYDKIQDGATEPYGTTAATRLVRLDADFRILEQWIFPPELLARFTPMSNSGGSWGPDGYLYITGHDHPEIYAVQIPDHGSIVEWVATVSVPQIEGQGIAWDRTADSRVLWGILKREQKVFSFAIPEIMPVVAIPQPLRTPPDFHRE
jgi:hypothetical protein